MKKYEHFCNIKDGKITGWDDFLSGLAGLFKPTDRIKITVQKVYRQRSSAQNRWFHGPVLQFVQDAYLSEWGENISLEQAKEKVKEYCHYKEIVHPKTGEIAKILLPTSELTTVEFEELNERVRKWLWDSMNYRMPEPNEQIEFNIF